MAKPWLRGARVYEPATFGVFTGPARRLARTYETSEYAPHGTAHRRGIRVRHEDIQALTFADGSLDLVITSEVFEHVADPWAGFREIRRVLRLGGRHIFTVPALPESQTSRRDAGLPVRHIDPLRPEGSLVVTDFGEDLPELLQSLGFETNVHHLPEAAPVLSVFESTAVRPRTAAPSQVMGPLHSPDMPAPRTLADTKRSKFMISSVLIAYLAGLTVAELAVTYINPLLVFPLHGGLIIIAATHVAIVQGQARAPSERRLLGGFLVAFMTAPLIRIISLTLPMGAIDAPVRYVVAGIPMLIGGILAGRVAGLDRRTIGLVWRDTPIQLFVIGISVLIGFVEFAILRPDAIGPLPWVPGGFLPALAVGIFTGFPEEFIFRGVMQGAARPLLGRWNWVYVSCVFAVLHIGYGSISDVVFVFTVGLLYGWVAERTRSILGVSIGHGVANVVLLSVAPNIPLSIS